MLLLDGVADGSLKVCRAIRLEGEDTDHADDTGEANAVEGSGSGGAVRGAS